MNGNSAQCSNTSAKNYCVVFSDKNTYGIFEVESVDEDIESWTNEEGESCFPRFHGCIFFVSDKKLELGTKLHAISLEAINHNSRSDHHFLNFFSTEGVEPCIIWATKKMEEFYGNKVSFTCDRNKHYWSEEILTEEFGIEELCPWQFILECAHGEIKADPRGKSQIEEQSETKEEKVTDDELNPIYLKEAIPSSTFHYEWCLNFKRDSIQAKTLKVRKIQFDISRYGKYKKTIVFSETVSIADAIEAVEQFLSLPLNEEYYNFIKKDLFQESPWEEAKKHFENRGDCLTDRKFLERLQEDPNERGLFVVFCGS